MRGIYLQPFIHIWPNRSVLHAGITLLFIGEPWENSWMFNIPDDIDRQRRFSKKIFQLESCFVWVPGSTTVCVCIAWPDAALQSLSTSVQCWYQGIVAATAAAASPTSPNWPRHNQIHLVVFSYLGERGHQVQTLWGRWGEGGGGDWGKEKKGKPLILTRSQTSSPRCSIHTHILLPQHTAQVGGGGWGW